MITCDMQGGLGNILFQVATAYSLAKRGSEAYFDLSEDVKCVTRHFNNLVEYKSNIFSRLNDKPRIIHTNHFSEPHFHYHEIPFQEDLFIHGYFQSYKYFSDYKKEIQELFAPTEEVENYIKSKYSGLLDNDTVSIHCRRGDYVKLKHIHALLEKHYYRDALNIFFNKTILFFSDDIDWCKKNLLFHDCHFIEGEKDYIDLYLMSKCKDNIICNSTFSWWGAYLNQREEKKVIAPNKWFSSTIKHSTHDLYPKEWIII